MNYYYVLCEIVPFCCRPVTYDVVISEKPFELSARQKRDGSTMFSILHLMEITEEDYNVAHNLNPTNESYLIMRQQDYSEVIPDDEEY